VTKVGGKGSSTWHGIRRGKEDGVLGGRGRTGRAGGNCNRKLMLAKFLLGRGE